MALSLILAAFFSIPASASTAVVVRDGKVAVTRISGEAARELYHSLTGAQENSPAGGNLTARIGANFTCTRTDGETALYECAFFTNEYGYVDFSLRQD